MISRRVLMIALYHLDRSCLPVWHPDRLDLEAEVVLLALGRIRDHVVGATAVLH
jgi:hypothetical protein